MALKASEALPGCEVRLVRGKKLKGPAFLIRENMIGVIQPPKPGMRPFSVLVKFPAFVTPFCLSTGTLVPHKGYVDAETVEEVLEASAGESTPQPTALTPVKWETPAFRVEIVPAKRGKAVLVKGVGTSVLLHPSQDVEALTSVIRMAHAELLKAVSVSGPDDDEEE